MSFYVGTDFGATKIRAGVVSPSGGRIVGRFEIATEAGRPVEAILRSLERAVAGACEAAGVGPGEVAGLGVAAPGQVDRATGTVVHAPNLDWFDVPLAALLERAYPEWRIAVLNDVNAAALGELRYGAGRGVQDLVAVFVGTGVGGGIVANGELVGGASGAAGEVGHAVYRPDGEELCGCGGRGHVESYAGGDPVARRLRDRIRAGDVDGTLALELAGGDPDRIHLGTIFEAAARGDAECRRLAEELEGALGVLCASLVSIMNPARLILGGGTVRRQPGLVLAVARAVEAGATRAAARAVKVVPSELWEDAAILGAVEALGAVGGAATGRVRATETRSGTGTGTCTCTGGDAASGRHGATETRSGPTETGTGAVAPGDATEVRADVGEGR